jgi:Flp pilus assembly protein CpaB
MKPKTMILMVVAVVCGLGASYMTSRLLAERDEPAPEAPPAEKVTVLVAKKQLSMHQSLGNKPEDFFVERALLKEDAPANAFTLADKDKLKRKFLKYTVKVGAPITPDDLMENNYGLKTLPPGMRAVGIRVNIEAIAGGFASLPGSHVDIMWTGRENGNGAVKAGCLLEDIIVLAADTNQLTPEAGGALPASVVTVALTPEDTMKVLQASVTGSLTLVLRNLEEGKKDKSLPTPVLEPRVTEEPKVDPKVDPKDAAKIAQDQQPKPKRDHGLRKFTVTAINASETKQYHYWLDANNNVVASPPQDALDDDSPPPASPPAGNEKKF